MTWKKFFRPVNSVLPAAQRTIDSTSAYASTSKYNNWLPEVYAGPPDRLQRYSVYDQMNFDHEISAALDTIADFGTEPDEVTSAPFLLKYNDEPTASEIQILEKSLNQWIRLNKITKRLWRMFRSTLVYGDQFFIRDPETFILYWIDPAKVEKVIVNESDGKKIESYFVKNVDLNMKSLVATNQLNKLSNEAFGANSIVFSPPMQGNMNYVSGGYGGAGTANYQDGGSTAVDAEHIVHISLTDGMTAAWPFGLSILEQIYKVYKQKELLEDSILIYRVHRAPERRMFFIDVGTMPPSKAQQYLERVRYEVQQKRIPSRTGGGANVVDSTYNPMCLDMNTEIPLLDGRIMTISQLAEEYKEGKENWVYSTDPITGKIVPGNITWAGITRKDAQVIKITLDNGETIISTPDHKIPVLGKGFVEAQYLTKDDPLISFETRHVSLSKDKERSYEQIYDHEINDWKFTHRVVAEFFKDIEKHQEFVFNEDCKNDVKDTVHHKDYNRYNNNPRNLQWMNRHDHTMYHTFTKKEFWENISEDESIRIKNKIRKSLEKYRLENPDWKERYENRDISWIQEMKDNEPGKFYAWRKKLGHSLSTFYKSGSDRASELKEKAANNLLKNKATNQQLNFTQPMLTRLIEIVKQHDSDRLGTIDSVNSDEKFMRLLSESNPKLPNSTGNVKADKFTNSKLERMYDKFGYKNWKDFKKKISNYNHRIVSIEWLENTQDVGTITVDGGEKWHKHHTFAVKSGIFVKNSILEDYFFAVTSEGRGSKVEVLPGGENLGEIDDLRYFNNKMMRALGVPSSYLPTGPEDGTAAVNDGRVGTAFIQEFRFAKVVARYQQQIIEPLDLEFKLFLKHRGITIDNSLFQLSFTPPQSFSEYRQLELDSAKINTFTALTDISFVSKRFILKRYLGWTEAELAENERMWKEERSRLTKTFDAAGGSSPTAGLSDIGITSSGIDNMAPPGEMPAGPEGEAPETGGGEMPAGPEGEAPEA
jgi:hypothetical protein